MLWTEAEIDSICEYLTKLHQAETAFETALTSVDKVYQRHLEQLGNIVILGGKTDWLQFSEHEKVLTENTVLLVNLLFQMCKVKLVLESSDTSVPNEVNTVEVEKAISTANSFLEEKGLTALT